MWIKATALPTLPSVGVRIGERRSESAGKATFLDV
jgi:hypothetical protein